MHVYRKREARTIGVCTTHDELLRRFIIFDGLGKLREPKVGQLEFLAHPKNVVWLDVGMPPVQLLC